jgi:hypothetical protein
MKKYLKVVGLTTVILFILAGSAMAYSVTYTDNTDSWPGYQPAGFDNIGHPQINSMVVTINDSTNNLESVVINLTDRLVWDSLFINTGGDGLPYEAWDFYVNDTELDNSGATLYKVAAQYTYLITTYPYRPDHPVGFTTGISQDQSGILIGVEGTATTLTYSFMPGIVMSNDFVIGYTPYCANDVILTPEPSILILFGLGLIGLAGVRRRIKK